MGNSSSSAKKEKGFASLFASTTSGSSGKKKKAAKPKKIKTTTSVLKQKLAAASKTGVLSLAHHTLESLPLGVLALDNVRTLEVSHNKLSELPAALGPSLPALKTLKCDGNRLRALPDLTVCGALATLSAADNALTLTGPAAPLPPSLTSLNLARNVLGQLPPAVAALTKLKLLDLSGNGIAALPADGVGASLGATLVELALDDNALAALPKALAAAARLKRLSLKNNKFVGKANRGAQQCIPAEVRGRSARRVTGRVLPALATTLTTLSLSPPAPRCCATHASVSCV